MDRAYDPIKTGACVRLDSKHIGRVVRKHEGCVDVRLRGRDSSRVLELDPAELKVIACPTGSMTPSRYREFKQNLEWNRQGDITCN